MPDPSRARRYRVIALVLLVVLTACRGPAASDEPESSPVPSARTTQPGPQQADRASTPITLAFAGDVHFEGGVAALLDEDDSTLGPLSAALRSADVAVVNLESALTRSRSRASKELEDPDQRYWFRTPPDALDLFERSGVDVVSMANNHGADYGSAGLIDSLEAAEDSDVGVIGIGDGAAQAYRPHVTTVDDTSVAVLAADASALESRDAIWNVRSSGPGIARADTRLISAVERAAADHDVVEVYLHWGEEGARCPTEAQRTMAADLSAAGADVIVGSHAHQLQGAGRLGDSYVSYGLGNFVWYHGRQAPTGVLQLQIADGQVIKETFVPGEIPVPGGTPRALTGADRTEAVKAWRETRACTGLAAGPGPNGTSAQTTPTTPTTQTTSAAPPANFVSAVQPVPTELRRRMEGSSHRSGCPVELTDLRLLTLGYLDFDRTPQVGHLVVHRDQARDVVDVFGRLYEARFPIARMRLIDDYGGDDDASMAANNTSAYNCRTVAGSTGFSRHAYGAAVDINPVQNPYVTGETVSPPSGRSFVDVDRSAGAEPAAGVIIDSDPVVDAFEGVGWQWGGRWTDPDYQHFDVR